MIRHREPQLEEISGMNITRRGDILPPRHREPRLGELRGMNITRRGDSLAMNETDCSIE